MAQFFTETISLETDVNAVSTTPSGITATISTVNSTPSGTPSAFTPTSTTDTINAVSSTLSGTLSASTPTSTTLSDTLSASTPTSTATTIPPVATSGGPVSSTKTVPGHTTSQSASTSPTVPLASGLDPSAKVGIGLGVPLGLIIMLVMMFLLTRYWKYKKGSGARHAGTIMATGMYTADDDRGTAVFAGEKLADAKELRHDVLDDKNIIGMHETPGIEAPAYSKELPGSPGVSRYELPARRGSV